MNEQISSIPLDAKTEAKRRVAMARRIQEIADNEVNKTTGEPEGPDTPRPHVWVIEDDDMKRPRHFTGTEGFRGASKDAREYLKKAIPRIESYVLAPHIVDDFLTHKERQDWLNAHLLEHPDLMRFAKDSRLSLNFLTSIQTAFEQIAEKTADLDCEEARYVRELVENTGKTDADGEAIGLPDLRKLYAGLNVPKDPEKNEEFTDSDRDELLQLMQSLKAGTIQSEVNPRNSAYDVMDPDKKWEIGYEYLQACKTFLKKVDESQRSERELAA